MASAGHRLGSRSELLAAAGNFGRGRLFFAGISGRLHGGAAGGFAAQAFEVRAKLRGGLAAEVAILLEAFNDDPFEFGGSSRIQPRCRWRSAMQNAVKNRGGCVALEGQNARGHFVEDDGERKKIAASVERFAEGLLRRHVGDGTDSAAGTGEEFGSQSFTRGAGGAGVLAANRFLVWRGRSRESWCGRAR